MNHINGRRQVMETLGSVWNSYLEKKLWDDAYAQWLASESGQEMEGRVKRDIWYIEHWSIWLDFRIIWLTFKSMFIHDKNAY